MFYRLWQKGDLLRLLYAANLLGDKPGEVEVGRGGGGSGEGEAEEVGVGSGWGGGGVGVGFNGGVRGESKLR